MLTVTSSHASRIVIDGEAIAIEIRRLTRAEHSAFQRRYDQVHHSESARRVSIRKPGEEQETRPRVKPRTPAQIAAAEALSAFDGEVPAREVVPAIAWPVIEACRALVPVESTDEVFVIPDAEIRRRRLEEMSPEEHAAWEHLDADEDTARDTFYEEAVSAYVTVRPGQIQLEERGPDGTAVREITAGADLVRLFGARLDVMRTLVDTIGIENTLSDPVKKAWWSQFDSVASSTGPATEAGGKTPATTATAAAPEASATNVDVTA